MTHTMNKLVLLVSLSILWLTSIGVIHAQEKESIRIDEQTVRVLNSPWKDITTGCTENLRGLHVVDANTVWASGTHGTVLVTGDGGESWIERKIEQAGDADIRDIHGFDEGMAIAITAGRPGRIYRTTSGGRTWKLCGAKSDAFFNSLSFWDDQNGIVMSDPVGGKFWIARTQDGGKSWRSLAQPDRINALPGEAGFAASGTNMQTVGTGTCFIGLGGASEGQSHTSSRILISTDYGQTFSASSMPIARSASAGIFSICFIDEERGVAVGGDYKQPDDDQSNYSTTRDGGKTWSNVVPRQPPSGYRSCVAAWKAGKELKLIAVGPNGTDLSTDLGQKWTRVSNHGFNSVSFSPDGAAGWAVGNQGEIARWILE